MRFITVCCFMLGMACAKYYNGDKTRTKSADPADMMMGKEVIDMDILVTPPAATMNTEDNSAYDEQVITITPSFYDHLVHILAEIQDLGLEEYFENFARTEMSDFLEVIPKPLSRFLLSESDPCKICTQKYTQCKDFCLQLLTKSSNSVLSSFTCIVICWQQITSCCIISRQTKAQIE